MNTIKDDMRIYLKSDNQGIIDNVEKYYSHKNGLRKKWDEFQDKYHVKLVGWDKHDGSVIVDGVIGDTSILPGQWRKPDCHGFSSPFKKNKEARGMLSSMNLKAPDLGKDIPHLTLETPLWGDAQSYFANTVFFEYDGYVYISCGQSVEPDQNVWSKIHKWEYEKAKEEKIKA